MGHHLGSGAEGLHVGMQDQLLAVPGHAGAEMDDPGDALLTGAARRQLDAVGVTAPAVADLGADVVGSVGVPPALVADHEQQVVERGPLDRGNQVGDAAPGDGRRVGLAR